MGNAQVWVEYTDLSDSFRVHLYGYPGEMNYLCVYGFYGGPEVEITKKNCLMQDKLKFTTIKKGKQRIKNQRYILEIQTEW